MAFGGTPSCSAATWMSAVLMPWPSSHLPVNTVMVLSASMRIQEFEHRRASQRAGQRRRLGAAFLRQNVRRNGEADDESATAAEDGAPGGVMFGECRHGCIPHVLSAPERRGRSHRLRGASAPP